jgi:chromosome segregation ATPase
MTIETRVTTIESQLQQLTNTVMTLAQTNLSNASHIAGLIEATTANTRAIDGLRQITADLAQSIAALNERIDRVEQRIEQLDQKLEERTDTILEAIDRGIERAIAQTVAPLQVQITGLQTEMQRVIEILGEIQKGD